MKLTLARGRTSTKRARPGDGEAQCEPHRQWRLARPPDRRSGHEDCRDIMGRTRWPSHSRWFRPDASAATASTALQTFGDSTADWAPPRGASRLSQQPPRGEDTARPVEAQGDAVIRPLEVWYTHASFFAEPISSLTAVARRLLERGIAYAVFSSEGQAWWADPPVLKEDWWGARRVGQSHSTQVWIPDSEDELVVKAGVEASRFAGQEQLLFNDTFRESTPYIRVFCDQCGLQMVSPASTILFRPQIKLYDNGVVLIHLALECEEEDVSFPDLIDNLVNLQAHSAKNLVVPPGVLLAADELSIVANTKGVADRAREIRERRVEITSLIAGNTSGESGERHSWAMGVSQSPDGRWINSDTLYDLYDFYRDGVASCVNLPHGALSSIARGRSALKNPPSVFWHARPSVHMVDPVTGLSEYLTVGSAAALQLGRLLARSSVLPAPVSSQHDANLRPAKDYLFFHNQALTVFVYGSEFPMESDGDEEIG